MRLALSLVALATALLTASPAAAYIGPGAGLGAIGALLALVAAVVLAIVGFLWYPLKRLFGAKRTKAVSQPTDTPTQ